MNRLPFDVCRCVGTTCGMRWRCKRFNDVGIPEDDPYQMLSYTDFSPELTPGIECQHYIQED